jgi:hypothetical protein
MRRFAATTRHRVYYVSALSMGDSSDEILGSGQNNMSTACTIAARQVIQFTRASLSPFGECRHHVYLYLMTSAPWSVNAQRKFNLFIIAYQYLFFRFVVIRMPLRRLYVLQAMRGSSPCVISLLISGAALLRFLDAIHDSGAGILAFENNSASSRSPVSNNDCLVFLVVLNC